MEDSGPASVTVEEAVAKIIGFDSLPEGVDLISAIDYMIDSCAEDLLDAQETGETLAEVERINAEYHDWSEMKVAALRILEDLERSIEQGDALLHIVSSDTCKTRLSTQSVYLWAKERHNITIDTWNEHRVHTKNPGEIVDREAEAGRQLFASVMWLTDELLSRDWRNWKGSTPDIRPKTSHQYFRDNAPNVHAIAQSIATHVDGGDSDPSRTISKHIEQATKFLTPGDDDSDATFSLRQRKAGYKTLVGLFRLLSYGSTAIDPSSDQDITKFVEAISVTSDRIHSKELETSLAQALRYAREQNF